MKWSWKLGEFAGIAVYVHATFLLLVGWIGLANFAASQSLRAAIGAMAFILALFVCVVLHEYGHALTARRYGIKTRDITLLPIGGLARLERLPEKPEQELWVALAGPAVNVVIAAVIGVWLLITGSEGSLAQMSVAGGGFLERLFAVNLFLVAFNMLPAFPMDGGRVLRALLGRKMDHARATNIAASLGQGMAFLFGFVGLFYNPFLIFIALFVWIGAQQEASAVQLKSATAGVPVSAAMITHFEVLRAEQTLEDAVTAILRGSQSDFPVIGRGELVGVLTKTDLAAALAKHDRSHAVATVMRTDFQVARADENLDVASQRLAECQCHTMPVVSNGHLVGLLTTENLGEYLLFKAAGKDSRDSGQGSLKDLALESGRSGSSKMY